MRVHHRHGHGFLIGVVVRGVMFMSREARCPGEGQIGFEHIKRLPMAEECEGMALVHGRCEFDGWAVGIGNESADRGGPEGLPAQGVIEGEASPGENVAKGEGCFDGFNGFMAKVLKEVDVEGGQCNGMVHVIACPVIDIGSGDEVGCDVTKTGFQDV